MEGPSTTAPPVPGAPLWATSPDELASLAWLGRPRAKAVWRHLREHPLAPLPETLTGCGKAALTQLSERLAPTAMEVQRTHTSADGTTKWTVDFAGRVVECVLIPQPSRSTVCVSTQSGCTRYCEFCATARMGFSGNLSADAIVGQVLLAKRFAPSPLTNVVMMGMGEPLDNLDAVLRAIAVIDQGLLISARHVTVSTSGLIPKMERLWKESRASLALSLHATTQELRDRLMPRVRKWPLTELTAWMREATRSDPRHVFIEYTLLDGINDSDADAERLAGLLTDIRCRINLIPFNPTPSIAFERPSRERVLAFRDRLIGLGYLTIVRETRGDDAAAACGQLAAGSAPALGSTADSTPGPTIASDRSS
ncbi:MAG TPA: 23S rRNA (adenine(2503)-C(2))-methyltransferase RlmN [Myxococcota bacterium]|nr:23S rRNA (adenine(2503)-C(2))-methyltransferase RlmN [Myxococcota bacterium]